MKLGSRGEGGFTGSMISLIAVITVLTVFMSVLPAAFVSDDEQSVPMYLVEGLSVSDGELVSSHDLNDVIADNDLIGIVVMVEILGTDIKLRMRSGDISGQLAYSDSGTFLIDVDGKRKMNARFEIGVWK